MPVRAFLRDESFDSETLEIMNAAYAAVCSDLGLADRTDGACEIVAKRVIELVHGERDPEVIRAVVLASIKTTAR